MPDKQKLWNNVCCFKLLSFETVCDPARDKYNDYLRTYARFMRYCFWSGNSPLPQSVLVLPGMTSLRSNKAEDSVTVPAGKKHSEKFKYYPIERGLFLGPETNMRHSSFHSQDMWIKGRSESGSPSIMVHYNLPNFVSHPWNSDCCWVRGFHPPEKNAFARGRNNGTKELENENFTGHGELHLLWK